MAVSWKSGKMTGLRQVGDLQILFPSSLCHWWSSSWLIWVNLRTLLWIWSFFKATKHFVVNMGLVPVLPSLNYYTYLVTKNFHKNAEILSHKQYGILFQLININWKSIKEFLWAMCTYLSNCHLEIINQPLPSQHFFLLQDGEWSYCPEIV